MNLSSPKSRNVVYPSGLSPDELAALLSDEPLYRVKQAFSWFSKGIASFGAMTNMPQPLRERLSAHFDGHMRSSGVENKLIDEDGSLKLQIRLRDGAAVECVLLEDIEGRKTACLSSQAGCPMGCVFCKTGTLGFLRNLGPDEIVEQFHYLRNMRGFISNVVFMGMGEPLLNIDNVRKAIAILSNPHGIGMSMRKITISTSGIVPGILDIAKDGPIVRLAVSLTSANPELRTCLMPVNRTWPLDKLKAALLEYQKITNDRITLEVVLIGNVNAREKDAQEMADWIHPLKTQVNLIAWNPIPGMPFETPSAKQVRQFSEILEQRGIVTVQRMSRGRGVMGACGQLGDTLKAKQ
ncbi:MAG: 23S rRNA (adenine(2503)-C(2))-methyltransferase RlmN [Rectinema sp.]